VLLFIFKREPGGRVFSHEQNLERLAPHCKVPIYSVWEFYLGHGIVGGRLASGRDEGTMAGALAIRILDGEKASAIPLGESPVTHKFDYAQLKRFGIDLSALPRGSIVMGKPFSFYEAYRKLIWAVAAIIAVLSVSVAVLAVNTLQRKRAESALRESEQKYRTLIDVLPHAVTIYQDGKVAFVNSAAARMFGAENTADVLGLDIMSRIADSERERVGALVAARRQGDKSAPDHYTTRMKRMDDTEFPAEVFVRPTVFNGKPAWQVVTMDISERERSEKEVARLALAVRSAAESILITNRDGVIQYVNPCFEKMTGYTMQEIEGRTPALLKSGKHDKAFYDDMWMTISSGETWHGHFTNRKKDGTLFEEDAVISPVRDSVGSIVNYVAVKRDVTHEMVLENQVRQSQKMVAVGQLANKITHTFTNALTRIMGHAQIISRRAGDIPDVARDLNQIMAAANDVSALAAELLAFSHPQKPRVRKLALDKVVAGVREILEQTVAPHVNLVMDTRKADGRVNVDPSLIEQAIVHMAINSCDAMPDGGRLTIETGPADLSPRELSALQAGMPEADRHEGGFAMLVVSDNGCGMTDEIKARIYEPFFTTKDPKEHSGLGLSTVYRIVGQHKGHIVVHSQSGAGATFKIYLPLAA
jgi:PAS domain S-box-containing protein